MGSALKKKYSEGHDERRGLQGVEVIEMLNGESPLWLHGVSVGEVQALMPVLAAARRSGYSGPVVISTTTETGKEMAFRLGEGLFDSHIYYPWDKRIFVRRAIESLAPWAFAAAETELWPNMLWELKDASIPAFLINGRISDRTWRRFANPLARRLGTSFYELFTEIYLRDQVDFERLRQIGVEEKKLKVFRNTKIDAILSRKNPSAREAWAARFGYPDNKVFVAGSTHIGEDEPVLEAFGILRERCHEAKLILAPRHPERAVEVVSMARQRYSADLLSEGVGKDVTVVDKIGVLYELYGIARAAFVGGSLVDRGGQNILEPVSWGIPIQYGPHMEDFAAASKDLIGLGIAEQISGPSDLGRAWIRIAESPWQNNDEIRKKSEEYFGKESGSSFEIWKEMKKYRRGVAMA